MSKNGSVSVLLVVAVIALGLMAFIGSNDGAAGAVAGTRNLDLQSSYSLPQQPETGSDVAQVQLQCYMWKYDHPNVQAPVEIAGLCASFGVTV